jgi:hypothetical protein
VAGSSVGDQGVVPPEIGCRRREQGLIGSDCPAPTCSRIPGQPRISPRPTVLGNGGRGENRVMIGGVSWALRPWLAGCSWSSGWSLDVVVVVGRFASRQVTASDDLGGPSRRLLDEVGVECTQCLPEGSR